MNKLYLCVGCREIHFDDDFCEEDGDLEIFDIEKFLESVDKFRKIRGAGK